MVGCLICMFAFYLRVKPRLKLKHYGVDAWYYLLYTEEFRKSKRIPIKLPYYLLDKEEQWYPPGFPLLLSLLPKNMLEKFQWLISPAIDCIQLLLLYVVTFLLTKSIVLAIVSGIMYASTMTLVGENMSLNSRSLGSLIFTMTMLCLLGFITSNNNLWLIPLILGGVVLLLTHKMSTQNLVFVVSGMSVYYKDIRLILILSGIFIVAIILTKGFYLNVLKGHLEILRFWKKNLHNLGAHQVYDSLLYKKPENYRDERFHLRGFKGVVRHIRGIIGNNWYAFFLIPASFLFSNGMFGVQGFYFLWAVLTYFMVIGTTFIPQLKFLGEGYKYIKLSIFPICVLTVTLLHTNLLFYSVGLSIMLLFNLYMIPYFYRNLRKNPIESMQGLEKVIEYLRKTKKDGIMTIPNVASDGLVYFTKKKVCWGGHSSGWNKLDLWFPVLKKPIEYFFTEYGLNFLLVDMHYVVEGILELEDFKPVVEENNYALYEWAPIEDEA